MHLDKVCRYFHQVSGSSGKLFKVVQSCCQLHGSRFSTSHRDDISHCPYGITNKRIIPTSSIRIYKVNRIIGTIGIWGEIIVLFCQRVLLQPPPQIPLGSVNYITFFDGITRAMLRTTITFKTISLAPHHTS